VDVDYVACGWVESRWDGMLAPWARSAHNNRRGAPGGRPPFCPSREAIVVSQTHVGRVLVVPSAELDRLGRFQGFSGDVERYVATLLDPQLAEFRPRAEVEEDPGYKQIIPYVIFRCGDLVFCYTRGTSQGEARLHRLRSLGVGGHVDEADADGRATIEAYELALRRELDEEVHVGSRGALRRVGLINDDSTPVGQVHLGVVHVFDLEQPEVSPRESGLAECGFVPLAAIWDARERFETWSRICLEGFLGGRPVHA
jgi:predicted NUDIX family phosphoesterase